MKNSSLGIKIRDLRKSKGFSLKKLGLLSGISKSYLWEIENKSCNPTSEKIRKIADALCVTTSYLLESDSELTDKILQESFFIKFNRLSDYDKKKIKELIELWSADA